MLGQRPTGVNKIALLTHSLLMEAVQLLKNIQQRTKERQKRMKCEEKHSLNN